MSLRSRLNLPKSKFASDTDRFDSLLPQLPLPNLEYLDPQTPLKVNFVIFRAPFSLRSVFIQAFDASATLDSYLPIWKRWYRRKYGHQALVTRVDGKHYQLTGDMCIGDIAMTYHTTVKATLVPLCWPHVTDLVLPQIPV